jgi:hypothetical protein
MRKRQLTAERGFIMKNLVFLLFAVSALLITAPALANHCDANLAAVNDAAASTSVGANVIQATAALVGHAMDACDREQTDVPLDPTYVTVGQAMLINAAELLHGN